MACDLWKLAIKQNYELLVENMNADELLPYLYQHHVITEYQKEEIKVEKLRYNQCQLLIDCICRCTPQFNPYGHFVRALRDKEQHYLADSVERTYEILQQDPSEATNIISLNEKKEDESCSYECHHRLTCRNCLSLYCKVLFVLTPFRYIWQWMKDIYQVLRPIPYYLFVCSKLLFALPPFKYVKQMLTRVNRVLMQFFHFIALQAYDHVIEPLVSASNSERLVFLLHLVGYNLSYIYVLFVMMPTAALLIYIIIALLVSSCNTSTCTHGKIPVTHESFICHIINSILALLVCGIMVPFPLGLKGIPMAYIYLTLILIILCAIVSLPPTFLPIFSISIMNICSLVYVGVVYGNFFNKSLFFSLYLLQHIVLCTTLALGIDGSWHMYVSLRHLRSIFTCDDQNFLTFFKRSCFRKSLF